MTCVLKIFCKGLDRGYQCLLLNHKQSIIANSTLLFEQAYLHARAHNRVQNERMEVLKKVLQQREVDHQALNDRRLEHLW